MTKDAYMVFELFSTILVDGAGAKAKKNSDEKKLKEAEGDPEKNRADTCRHREKEEEWK